MQNNKIIDNQDLQDFENVYLKYCNKQKLTPAAQCGPKDINGDHIINLEDYANFAKLYAQGKCN